MQQIPLPFRLDEGTALNSFVPGPNAEAVAFLSRFLECRDEPQVYLWCGEARGKSHLAQGLCLAAGREGLRASYLPLSDLKRYGPAVLDGLELLDVICLDDIDTVAGLFDWNEALFHLINRCRSSGAGLLITAHDAPDALPVSLKDLSSRLQWGPVFHLKALDEVALKKVIDGFAESHGMDMDETVVDYLIARYDRSVGTVITKLMRIDERALEAQRKITIPFVRTTLGA